MAEFKRQVQNRRANKFTVIYTVEKLFNISLFLLAIGAGFFLISYLLRKNDEMMTDFYRKKLAKMPEDN